MKKRFLPLALLLVMALQSCALPLPFLATQTPTPTPIPTATPTPTPTPTPSPTPSPTPVPRARIDLGALAILSGDYAAALQDFKAAQTSATEDETRAAALVGIGRVQYLQGSPDTAIATLKDEVSRFPKATTTANAYYFLALAYTKMKNLPKAADSYAAYLKARPGVLDAYMQEQLGDTLAALGDAGGALKAYMTSIQAPRLDDSTGVAIKVGKMYLAQSDYKAAVRKFLEIYDATQSGFYKAQANNQAGLAYLNLGQSEQAYARYLDSVNNYPSYYDTYTGLIALVNAGVGVDEFQRGLVDYYAGQYGLAVEAFNRYLDSKPEQLNWSAHYYKGLSLLNLDQPEAALAEWDLFIQNDPSNKLWTSAWDEKALTLWSVLGKYSEAAQTMLDFVERVPDSPDAPANLYEAARIYERKNMLAEAAATWEQVMQKYPASDWGYRSLLLAGVTYFRMGNLDQAMNTFQRALVLGATPEEQSSAGLWVGKVDIAQGKPENARIAWTQAADRDPTGYYSERARELLAGQAPFQDGSPVNTDVDMAAARKLAEGWLRVTFNIAPEKNLAGPGSLTGDARYKRGVAFWELGLNEEARSEFESLRLSLTADAEGSFHLLTELLQMGFYRSAILTSRQILDLAGLDDAGTLLAPAYFNYIRFGTYFSDAVNAAAKDESLDPLFLDSVLRQESLFEGFASSGAGARGVMQIIPATGTEEAKLLGWPDNFTTDDLYLPAVSIRLGSHYMARLRGLFNGDLYGALAAYNGGPGNAQAWMELSGDDPDLFLEVVRIKETRDYIQQIFMFYYLYQRVYRKATF